MVLLVGMWWQQEWGEEVGWWIWTGMLGMGVQMWAAVQGGDLFSIWLVDPSIVSHGRP